MIGLSALGRPADCWADRDPDACGDASSPWVRATAWAPWTRRFRHTTVVFDDKLWVLGGYRAYPDYDRLNDVWYSPDGTNWTRATAHAAWPPRAGHASAVFDDRLWVLGGYADGIGSANDVWYSAEGMNWTQATAHAAWPARGFLTTATYAGKLWVLGGDSGSREVWHSTDGETWALATDQAPWPGRQTHAAAVFNNRLWVLGGHDFSTYPYELNDIWHTSDGITWVQATSSAPWQARYAHKTAVFNNSLWVLGGAYEEGSGHYEYTAALNDVWRSADGENWTMECAHAPWLPRYGHTTAVFQGKLWLLGGRVCTYDDYGLVYYDVNDIWYLPGPHSADVDGDWRMSVVEMGRVVGFLNAGAYQCAQTTEDGYAPFTGPQDCDPHNSDFNPQDWAISIPEVSRLVTFYNAGGYRVNPDTPDGFEPAVRKDASRSMVELLKHALRNK